MSRKVSAAISKEDQEVLLVDCQDKDSEGDAIGDFYYNHSRCFSDILPISDDEMFF